MCCLSFALSLSFCETLEDGASPGHNKLLMEGQFADSVTPTGHLQNPRREPPCAAERNRVTEVSFEPGPKIPAPASNRLPNVFVLLRKSSCDIGVTKFASLASHQRVRWARPSSFLSVSHGSKDFPVSNFNTAACRFSSLWLRRHAAGAPGAGAPPPGTPYEDQIPQASSGIRLAPATQRRCRRP